MGITYEEEGEHLQDKSPCAGIRADLKMCLLESDCCRVVSFGVIYNNSIDCTFDYSQEKKLPRECLNRTDGSVPDRCLALRNTFFECKRSLVGLNSLI